jgi:1-deoxy-D-xylulose 5-phosphate reductoisomerase
MVFPLIPAGIAALGIAGGYGINSFLGGTKKEASSVITHAPYETYAPVSAQQYQYNPQYAVQIESPGASITKKDVLTEQARQTAQMPQITETGRTEGTDITKLAVIGVVGLVAYGLVSGRKK